jgi:fermentation-respiration switch protein FrsA (DUF1100 family)
MAGGRNRAPMMAPNPFTAARRPCATESRADRSDSARTAPARGSAVAALAPRPPSLIHGAADRLIPVANARALYAAAGGPKELWLVPARGHAAALARCPDE